VNWMTRPGRPAGDNQGHVQRSLSMRTAMHPERNDDEPLPGVRNPIGQMQIVGATIVALLPTLFALVFLL
jgi:hypothetical protein